MGWHDGPLVGFDTETTGVDVATDRIVTAAVVTRDATGTRARTWLIDPGVPIPPAATAVHGITTEQARTEGRAPRAALDEGQVVHAVCAASCSRGSRRETIWETPSCPMVTP